MLHKVAGVAVKTSCAGRTDAGVHARGQVMSFDTDADVEPVSIVRAVNRILGSEVSATNCQLVADDFDARHSASWRSYRYQILNQASPDPFRRYFTWHVPDLLDVKEMNRAAAHFVGPHDFASFCRRPPAGGTERTVYEASWGPVDDLLVLFIRARAFCHQMVRSVTGFCIDVGRGRVSADSVPEVLAARDRNASRPMAPPQGLILWEVGY